MTAIGFSGARSRVAVKRPKAVQPRSTVPGSGHPLDYAEFLKGKRCIIVGPAGYLQGKGLGKWIDSYDVVIRLNWGVPVPPQIIDDLGERCDILYKRLLKLGHLDFIDVKEYAASGVKWVIAVDTPHNTFHVRHMTEMLGDSIKWFVDNTVRQALMRELHTSPLLATIAVRHLLAHDVKEVMITGCDFYQTGYYDGYGGREYRESMQRKEGTIGPTHDAGIQLRYLSRTQKEDSRLVFDETLELITHHAPVDHRLLLNTVAIIPARYESSRFPGKPLALINGKPMILWVCERVAALGLKVYVATDDKRIAEVVEKARFKAIMTKDALTGTDRVAQAARTVPANVYLNVQGDEPLIDPQAILSVLEAKRRTPNEVINAMTPLRDGEAEDRNVVKAVVKSGKRLVYCSRAAIPAGKDGNKAAWKQLGLYAFSRRELALFGKADKRAVLEEAEDVEILRFIELGVPVRMIAVDGSAQSVDLPEHIEIVERLMK